MTRDEALSILKTFRITGDKAHEAFDMAIRALESPPNDNWDGYSKRLYWDDYSKRLWKNTYKRGYDEGYKQACKDKIESPYCAESEDEE